MKKSRKKLLVTYKMLNKSVKSIKKVPQKLKSDRYPLQPKTCNMQKPANQTTMQVNALVATKRAPKTRGHLRTQSASDVLWTSNEPLYEVQTSYRRLLDV